MSRDYDFKKHGIESEVWYRFDTKADKDYWLSKVYKDIQQSYHRHNVTEGYDMFATFYGERGLLLYNRNSSTVRYRTSEQPTKPHGIDPNQIVTYRKPNQNKKETSSMEIKHDPILDLITKKCEKELEAIMDEAEKEVNKILESNAAIRHLIKHTKTMSILPYVKIDGVLLNKYKHSLLTDEDKTKMSKLAETVNQEALKTIERYEELGVLISVTTTYEQKHALLVKYGIVS